jgi:hypothetical protein
MTVPVATLAGYQSAVTGYAGVYDLSGNRWEIGEFMHCG